MQLYRGLPILTNQSPARLVGIWPLDHEASVAEYQALAHAAIDEILAAGRTPIVAGGTGLYLRAALADLSLPPAPEPGERERWEQLYDTEGPEQAHAQLAELDPEAAAAVHPNDRRRVVRSLELAGQRPRAGPALDRRDASSDDRLRPRRAEGGARPPDRGAHTGDVRGGRARRGRAGPRRRSLVDRAPTRTASQTSPSIPTTKRRSRLSSPARSATPRTSASGCGRIPGLVSLPANRPPGEVADDILEVARARQRLPAGRAG